MEQKDLDDISAALLFELSKGMSAKSKSNIKNKNEYINSLMDDRDECRTILAMLFLGSCQYMIKSSQIIVNLIKKFI